MDVLGALGASRPAPGPRPDPVPDVVPDGELICSAKGCRATAVWGLLWNNPKLHTPDRRKVWLACDDHREHLEQFLSARGFWKQTVPVAELDRAAGPGTDPAS